MEVMATKQRTDLQMNIPALRKLDAMLIDCLDGFNNPAFSYVEDDESHEEKKAAGKMTNESYRDLPKNGRESLGDSIYKSITEEYFDPDYFFTTMDLSSEHKILDLKDRIEASVVIWRRKMNAKDGNIWGSLLALRKRNL
ncbi:hypothetical protein HAX54_034380 [Datura stramonium]|uniref:PRONE domain-containing protein n=1 Tax=Datura stramonium TaxID=4076 RepID=A0ABS8SEG2_DATST|nr:hypothetical protein [Datura stramonium]